MNCSGDLEIYSWLPMTANKWSMFLWGMYCLQHSIEMWIIFERSDYYEEYTVVPKCELISKRYDQCYYEEYTAAV